MLKKPITYLLTLLTITCQAEESLMQSEIKHVVVLMLENRSFDNVLAWLYSQDNPPEVFLPPSTEHVYYGLEEDSLHLYQNYLKDSKGNILFGCHPIKGIPSMGDSNFLNSPTVDPHEPFPHVTQQIFGTDGGTVANMSGFLQDYASLWWEQEWSKHRSEICAVMETYTEKELPVTYALARHYAVSDMWFSSVPTQTNPNRAFGVCGTSEGEIVNGFLGTNYFTSDTIWNRLYEQSPATTWKVYWQADMLPGVIPGSYYRNLYGALDKIEDIDSHFEYIDAFHEQARNGELPDFSYLEPQWTISITLEEGLKSPGKNEILFLGIQGNDMHPPGDVRTAENFLANVYTSLISNEKAWNETLLIITFDEHGGIFDHIPPPAATPPDDHCQHGFNFDRFGVRIPTIFVSPKVKKKTVVRSDNPEVPFDHTSVLATVLKWKEIAKDEWNLGKRTAAAPTFENIINGDARQDAVLTDQELPALQENDILKIGDTFCLKNSDGEYLIDPKTLDKMNAQLGSVDDKAVFTFGPGSGSVRHGSFVTILNQSGGYGEGNVLEITLNHCDCRYNCNIRSPRQWWTVKSVDHPYVGSEICYGDKIYLENHVYLDPFQYIPARLAKRNFPYGEFVTTKPVSNYDSSSNYWTVERN